METFLFICKCIFPLQQEESQTEVICFTGQEMKVYLCCFALEQGTLPRSKAVSIKGTAVASVGALHFSTVLI